MKYINEFRDSKMAKDLAAAIRHESKPDLTYHFMEFCGGHTHAIFRYGIQALLPENVKMIHGPGCPVCVLPIGRIDMEIEMAQRENVVFCTYADVVRVPGSGRLSLQKIQAAGADVRMIYSTRDVLTLAKENPDKEIIFFAIGFETTAPPTAAALDIAKREGIKNFSVFCNHVVTPAAISNILESIQIRKMGSVKIDGFIGPSHVSTVIGTQPYEYFTEEYAKPVVVAGFEPLDVMQALLMLIRQVNRGEAVVENEYTRAVTREGNLKAKRMVSKTFELRESFHWRGLGAIPYSAFRLSKDFREFDAEARFGVEERIVEDAKGCECGAILRGQKRPTDCKLFGKGCTPEQPVGSCMVSSEGACAAYYTYGRYIESSPLNGEVSL
jgi:hydrogenase expression/formation protein HypD